MELIDILFILSIALLYFIPKKSKKYKLYWIIPLTIFLVNLGIRLHLIDQNYKNTETIARLERKIHVWKLSEEQMLAISERIKKYKDIKVKIIRENSPEINEFVKQLVQVFKQADWTVMSDKVNMVGGYNGITIYAHGNTGGNVPGFVGAFYHALKNSDIVIEKINGNENAPNNVLSLEIGKRK